MLSDCKLKDLFLIEQLPTGVLPIYECDQYSMVATQGGMIKRANATRVRLSMMNEEWLTDGLLYDLIYTSASSNKTYMPHEIQLIYEVMDLPITWMLKPNTSVDLKKVFGNEYYTSSVMETDLVKIKEIEYKYLPEGEVIFLPSGEYSSRIALGSNDDFGACICYPQGILKCVYDSKV